MRAGRLDRVLHLQAPGAIVAPDPEPSSYTTYATVPAERLSPAGLERFTQSQTLAEVSQGYRIRYRTDVTATHRALDGDAVWQIVAAFEDDSERRRSVTILLCERAAPNDGDVQ